MGQHAGAVRTGEAAAAASAIDPAAGEGTGEPVRWDARPLPVLGADSRFWSVCRLYSMFRRFICIQTVGVWVSGMWIMWSLECVEHWV